MESRAEDVLRLGESKMAQKRTSSAKNWYWPFLGFAAKDLQGIRVWTKGEPEYGSPIPYRHTMRLFQRMFYHVIQPTPTPTHLIILCGTNLRLKRKLDGKRFSPNTHRKIPPGVSHKRSHFGFMNKTVAGWVWSCVIVSEQIHNDMFTLVNVTSC